MSYTEKGDLVPITATAQISGTTTLEGPVIPYAFEVGGAIIASPSNSMADDADNNFLIEVKINGRDAACSINTGITDINANSVAFPTVSTNSVLTRGAAGEQLTIVITEENTAANIAPGCQFFVQVYPVFDHSRTG